MAEEQVEKVSQEQIGEWKEQYGRLFKTVCGPYEFYWHPFTRKTYRETLAEDIEAVDTEDLVQARRVLTILQNVVYPEAETLKDILESRVGIIDSLSDEILKESGFYAKETEEL